MFVSGPIGLVNMMTAKACGASKVAITGMYSKQMAHLMMQITKNLTQAVICTFRYGDHDSKRIDKQWSVHKNTIN